MVRLAAPFLILIGTLTLVNPARAESLQASGPRHLVISYRANPSDRPAFRRYLTTGHTAKLRQLRARGVIEDYRLYYSWYAQPNAWDAMLIVRFSNFSNVSAWNELERTSPGGLSEEGMRLATPISTAPADLEWAGPDQDSPERVYLILPYEYRSAGEYRRYVPGYLLPQLEGWLQDGALAGFNVFMNRYPVGPSWDSLLILAYRDMDAFGRRQAVLDKRRAELGSNTAWAEWHERKDEVREASENIIAELLPR